MRTSEDTISPFVVEAYDERREHMNHFLDSGKPPLTYWPIVDRCTLKYFVALVNGEELIVQMEILIKHFAFLEVLVFDCDRTARFKVITNKQREILEVRDRVVLSLLASLYESLGRDLRDPEWSIKLGISRQHVMLGNKNHNPSYYLPFKAPVNAIPEIHDKLYKL